MNLKIIILAGMVVGALFFNSCSADEIQVPQPKPEPELPGTDNDDNGIVGEKDLMVKVVSAVGTVNGRPITDSDMKKTYDGDRSTVLKKGINAAYTYEFGEGEVIDYVIYYPYNLSGDDFYGSWGLVDISIMEEGEEEFKIVYKDKNFGASELPTVTFFEGHKKIKAIRFFVKNGEQGNEGWSGCSEMEFYRQEDPLFDPLTLFKDQTCSDLKEGITKKNIETCTSSFYRSIAQAMYDGTYQRMFRIQEFIPHPHPVTHAKANLINGFSLYENVTGIYVDQGEKLTVFVSDMNGESVTLKVIDLQSQSGYSQGGTLPLRPGFNQWEVPNKGLVYVAYHTDNYETALPVKIHFATGKVNGYFDVTKHRIEQWPEIINNTVCYFFDMVGRRSHITFASSDFRQYCNDPFKLMEGYDTMMDLGEEFTGLKKCGRELKNRVYINYNSGSGGALAAADNHIVWNNANGLSIPAATTPNKVWEEPWGVAHELGHELQIRPGRQRYQGMLEVTNNLLSIYVQLKFGNKSRLFTSVTSPAGTSFQSEFERAMTYYGAEKRPHNYNMRGVRTVLTKLIPLWQLYLYANDVRGEDWFKDFYEELRLSNLNSSQGDAQIDLVRTFCNVSKLNLLEFFKRTGFLTPMDEVTDNGETEKFTITQKMIDQLVTEIKAKNYPEPDVQIWRLTDQEDNIAAFKEKKAVLKGTAIRNGKTFSMTDWKNVVAYEVYTQGKLVFVSPHQNFTVEGNVDDTTYINAVSAIGETTRVTIN